MPNFPVNNQYETDTLSISPLRTGLMFAGLLVFALFLWSAKDFDYGDL